MGGAGYHIIGGGRWDLSSSMYMAVVTLSTVGFSETLPGMAETPWARPWTVLLILFGSGSLLYFASTLTAVIVEGDLQGLFKRRSMSRSIDKVDKHVIVCGIGATGLHVAIELKRSDSAFVVVERSMAKIEELEEEIGEFLYVIGDATHDHVLIEAQIDRARGLVTTLTDDRDNLFVTLTARALREDLRIISKVVHDEAKTKLHRAGADVAVSPSLIGGVRMASEMLRPSVVQFLDQMLRDQEVNRRIEEIAVPHNSSLIGKTLQEVNLRETADSLVVAIRENDGSHLYNPSGNVCLAAGHVLIVMARTDEISKLRKYVAE